MREFTEEGQEGGLAAAFFRRFQAQIGADIVPLEGAGVQRPQGQGFGGPPWQDDKAREHLPQITEKGGAIDRLRPRFDLRQFQKGAGDYDSAIGFCIRFHN